MGSTCFRSPPNGQPRSRLPTPLGAAPYVGLGCLHFLVCSGRCWLPGVHQGSIPFVLCVFVWPWLSCVVGAVLVFCSVALCAALHCPCTRVLLLCVLRRAAPLCASANFVCLDVALSCAALVCVVRLCSVVCLCGVPHCAVCCAASTKNGGHGYKGHGHTLLQGPSPGNLRRLGCRHTPVGGAGSKHTRPTNENCMQISPVRLCRFCVNRRCAVLYCSGVCCAVLFRCVPLSALACRDALCAMLACRDALCAVLCAMLHHQRMAAMATRATATLFHGGQVPATSEALRCCHTPVGGAGSKHPPPPPSQMSLINKSKPHQTHGTAHRLPPPLVQ